MTQVACDAGLSWESLCRSLGPDGNPELATVLAVMKALGFTLDVAPAERSGAAGGPTVSTA